MIHYDWQVSPACPSGYALDLLLADELGDGDAAVREHVATCSACRERLIAMEAGRAERDPVLVVGRSRGARADPRPRLRLVPAAAGSGLVELRAAAVAGVVAPRGGRRWGSRWAPAVSAACLAAAGVALVSWPTSAPIGSPDMPPAAPVEVTRVKGDAILVGFYVEHGGEARVGGPGEVVHPGDSLQFVYTAAEAGFLAIVSRDGAGAATIYFDDGAGRAAVIAAGSGVALPRSVVLDGTLGRETLHVLGCDRAELVEPFRAAAASVPEPAPPPGCRVQRIAIDKRPP